MNSVFIVIKEYDDQLAKRQPWYTVNALEQSLNNYNIKSKIINSLSQVPSNYTGVVIKTWGIGDIFYIRKPNVNYKLVYLITFPFYRLGHILGLGFNTLFINFKGILRIFLASLLPVKLIKHSLSRSDLIIYTSDRSRKYLPEHVDNLLYIPYISGNWGGESYIKPAHNDTVLGYFGSPIPTRGFDDVIQFYSRNYKEATNYKLKLITRTERINLLKTQNKYLPTSLPDNIIIKSGFLSRSDLAKELQQVDILLLPFKLVLSELPIVVIEAIEYGIPVITTHECGLTEVFDKLNLKGIFILDRLSRTKDKELVKFISTNTTRPDFSALEAFINASTKSVSDKVTSLCQK